MVPSKRKIDVVDLTGSDEETENRTRNKGRFVKQPRFSNDKPQAIPLTKARAPQTRDQYPTPPSSSQPTSSSANNSFSQVYSQTSNTGECSNRTAIPHGWLEEEWPENHIDLTQNDDDDEYESCELFGISHVKIVGVRYYDGRATVGEYVVVRREPSNQYDPNAIRIDNVMGAQIGHLARQVAVKLAPLMDSKSLLVEGSLTGPKGDFDCPIALKLYGTTDPVAAQALKQQMMSVKLPVVEFNKAERQRKKRQKELEKQQKKAGSSSMQKNGGALDIEAESGRYAYLNTPGLGLESQPETLEQVMEFAQSYNPREVQDVVDKLGVAEDVLSQLPLGMQPTNLETKLLPYQLQGLKWMQDRESATLPPAKSADVVQLWKRHQTGYLNIATNFFSSTPPSLAQGGILADDMGLGKTIQIISLIIAEKPHADKPTLIIAPLSVMSNWTAQVEKHVSQKHQPKCLIYHGQNKGTLGPAQFANYDIVITTYHTMAFELFPSGAKEAIKTPTAKGLFSTKWRRIVLDEGHQIRNPKAKMTRAAYALQAEARWVLTGTPIVNNLKDLYSHVHFLRMTGGLEQLDIFNSTLTRPMKNGDRNASVLLRALMSTISLRRMKDMKFIDLKLPEIVSHKYPIKFFSHEQEKYDIFRDEAKGLMGAMMQNSGNNKTYTGLLEVLLRMRQCCNHWKLCSEDRLKRIIALIEENKLVDVTNKANRRALQAVLQLKIDSQEECPICMDPYQEPMITACGHVFCFKCIDRVIEIQRKCPMCRNDLKDVEQLVSPAIRVSEGEDCKTEDEEDEEPEIDPQVTSSKVEALIKILKASQNAKDTKTVVFSQWTSFLNVIQAQLDAHGLQYTRLDGSMSAQRRDAAINALDTDPDCRIMLASLSVCSVGLNLVSANQVILSDSWWAPAIEDQAVDRVHRLGQRRNCSVMRLVMEDSIEEEVLEIQAKKRKLMGQAFGEDERTGGSRKRGEERMGRLRDIEQMLK